MIVYNAGRLWFTMKADADAHRKAQGLPPAKLVKVTVNSREGLAAVLNGLCGLGGVDQHPATPSASLLRASAGPALLPAACHQQAAIEMPSDGVPQFLQDRWAKLQEGWKA